MLAESGAGDGAAAREFFAVEYRLNALLHAYPKPTLAVMDGVTMGGGVGISRPCRYRIATERTVFAMPETGIGLFPDVGGGWFLPRMPGRIGLWLALTGARLKAADCLLTAVATHHVESAQLDALKAAVLADPGVVETLLAERGADAGPAPLAQVQDDIDRLFGGESLAAVADALGADDGEWARAQGHVLSTKSPHSMAVAFRQLREGAAMPDFAAEMAAEFRLASRVVHSPDFLEGVRALIVDKDGDPRWSPPTVGEVTPGHARRRLRTAPAGPSLDAAGLTRATVAPRPPHGHTRALRRRRDERSEPGDSVKWVRLAALVLSVAAVRPAAAATSPLSAPDPSLVRGTLPNGLRYAILPNRTPRQQVSIRMQVDAGAALETDAERGAAHFRRAHGVRRFPPLPRQLGRDAVRRRRDRGGARPERLHRRHGRALTSSTSRR